MKNGYEVQVSFFVTAETEEEANKIVDSMITERPDVSVTPPATILLETNVQ